MLLGAILPKLVHHLLSIHAVRNEICYLTEQCRVQTRPTLNDGVFSTLGNRLAGNVMVGYSHKVNVFSNASGGEIFLHDDGLIAVTQSDVCRRRRYGGETFCKF